MQRWLLECVQPNLDLQISLHASDHHLPPFCLPQTSGLTLPPFPGPQDRHLSTLDSSPRPLLPPALPGNLQPGSSLGWGADLHHKNRLPGSSAWTHAQLPTGMAAKRVQTCPRPSPRAAIPEPAFSLLVYLPSPCSSELLTQKPEARSHQKINPSLFCPQTADGPPGTPSNAPSLASIFSIPGFPCHLAGTAPEGALPRLDFLPLPLFIPQGSLQLFYPNKSTTTLPAWDSSLGLAFERLHPRPIKKKPPREGLPPTPPVHWAAVTESRVPTCFLCAWGSPYSLP